ncbi:MAG: hypothetical protein AABX01_02420 [Candidatus Micrarchaeota archaeon]
MKKRPKGRRSKSEKDPMQLAKEISREVEERIKKGKVPTVDEMWGSMPNIDFEGFKRNHAKEP